jgi:acetyl-CoA acetyltransferase
MTFYSPTTSAPPVSLAPAARVAGMAAALELSITGKRYALATMCTGVGQGIAVAFERV